jgi:hypothetical protein
VISDADRIGELLKQFGIKDPLPVMSKKQYDDLFVVTTATNRNKRGQPSEGRPRLLPRY